MSDKDTARDDDDDDGQSVPVGTIVATVCKDDSLPDNWLLCNGSDIPAQYGQLCEMLGGTKTPNLIGRTLIGAGTLSMASTEQTDKNDPQITSLTDQPALNIRETGGECFHTLDKTEIPSHAHTINGGDFGVHHRSFKGSDDGNDFPYETCPDGQNLKHTNYEGNGQAHLNMQPYYAVNYLIYAGTP